MLQTFIRTIRQYRLIKKNDTLVVGVSGGPDSVALLYLLAAIRRPFNLTLHVAHLDHALRRDSSGDAEFVKRLAAGLGLPATVERVTAGGLKGKGSLEEKARKRRFEFLFKVAAKTGARTICLGHTLDDQAETVLMRLIRGTGLMGLAAISPMRKFGKATVVRPLIGIRRSQVLAFLKKRKIAFRTDTSNLKESFFRNKVRLRLLPLLEASYNRNIRDVLANTAESVACDYDYLLERALRAQKSLGRRMRIRRLLALHPALRRLVYRLHFAAIKGDMRRLAYRHIQEIEDLVAARPAGSVVDLPQEVSVRKTKDSVIFYRRRHLI